MDQTTAVRAVPSTRWIWLSDTSGQLRAFHHDDQWNAEALEPHTVLDLSQKKLDSYGILDFTFHPRFPDEPWCFLTYGTAPKQEDGLHLARFRVDMGDHSPHVDLESERIVLSWPNTGHAGSCIRFGPDGYLYAVTGDGAGPNPPDPLKTGQDVSDLLSSMLRLDVDHSTERQPYRIPPDNPFVRMAGARGEIWAYGFRNPWKFCFERTGALWVADVGWDTFEPIYRVEKGGNYGWSIMEGSQPVRTDVTPGPTPILPPVVEHSHLEARSITGGEFYYGTRLPELTGAMIYGDWQTGKVWGLKHDGQQTTFHQELVDTPLQVICFFTDPEGDVCIVGYDGRIYRLEPNQATAQDFEFPQRLSETGLFASTADHQPAPGVVPYWVQAEPWADGATSSRLIALPPRTQLSVFQESNWEVGQVEGHIRFPPDAVLVKTVHLEMQPGNPQSRRRIETQLLHRYHDAWNAYNYIWNEQQTDAQLAPNRGTDRPLMIVDAAAPHGARQQTWHHASRSECLLCHVWSSGSVLGFKLHQLDREIRTGGGFVSQLKHFQEIALFDGDLTPKIPKQVSPYDETADIEDRARAYLHLNCSQCHRSEGGGLANFDARQTPPLERTNLINSPPMQGDFGIPGARIVVAGQPQRSLLLYRMSKLGRGRMPHLGSTQIDVDGLRLIRSWIHSLEPGESAADAEPTYQRSIASLANGSADAADLLESIHKTLETPVGALSLLGAIDEGRVPAPVVQQIVTIASQHSDTRVRDLFERFVPEPERVQRLGTDFNFDTLAGAPGNADEGKRLFHESNDLSCRNCHPVNGVGKMVGPDLRDVGQRYTKRQVLEHIVFPSRKIEEKYQTHVVETLEGRVVGGLLIREAEDALVLRDAAGKDVAIPRADIEFHTRNPQSLMPDHQLRDLTPQQAADLLAFLETLKQTQ